VFAVEAEQCDYVIDTDTLTLAYRKPSNDRMWKSSDYEDIGY